MRFFNFLKKNSEKSELAKKDEVEVRRSQQESLDRLNGAFTQLVDKLENINSSLNRHIEQQEELLKRFEVVPDLTRQQTELIEQTLEQLNEQSVSTKEFTEIVARIPDEAVRQTRELEQIKNNVSQSADLDKSVSNEFVKLNVMFNRQYRLMCWLTGVFATIVTAGIIYYLFR
jgi:DNA repair ATPase RecN